MLLLLLRLLILAWEATPGDVGDVAAGVNDFSCCPDAVCGDAATAVLMQIMLVWRLLHVGDEAVELLANFDVAAAINHFCELERSSFVCI